MDKYPTFKNRIMQKFLENYDWQIRRVLKRKRKVDVDEIKERLDYMLTLENKNKDEKDEEKWFSDQRLQLYKDQ